VLKKIHIKKKINIIFNNEIENFFSKIFLIQKIKKIKYKQKINKKIFSMLIFKKEHTRSKNINSKELRLIASIKFILVKLLFFIIKNLLTGKDVKIKNNIT
tara:strand:- start:4 stop:306 length:303 start_codon:yes stop_codon:yes gene_type:complete